jgi:hypothetical protein
MTNQVIDSPRALDEAIEAKKQVRRDALKRAARSSRVRIADVLWALVILLALVQIFVEPRRAIFPAAIACLSILSIYISCRSSKQNAADELRDL